MNMGNADMTAEMSAASLPTVSILTQVAANNGAAGAAASETDTSETDGVDSETANSENAAAETGENAKGTDENGDAGESGDAQAAAGSGYEEIAVNLMHGYTVKMEDAHVRESITPIGEDRQVSIRIDTYGQKVKNVFYEVRSVDGSRLIENTMLTGLAEKDGQIDLAFKVKDLIEKGVEYSLNIVLTLEDGREVRYYTRIIQADYKLAAKLEFIREFHEATFDIETLREYSRYLESNSSGDNSTLAKVNIHSSLSQVAWGGLDVKKKSDVQIQIREIAPQTASVVLSYVVSYPYNDQRETAVVEEYYRIRYTADRTYLLDYERTMTQLFDEAEDKFINDKISLGIVDKNVEMKESDGGTVFAFVNSGALYSYNGADDKLARLFSFYEKGQQDVRTLYNAHDYEILQVDEAGNVTFLVYGYMNRGRHEGECGVQVSYYSSTLNVVEELAFIPYTKSADILHADIDNLSYVNGKNDLYLMLDGCIYHVGLEDKSWDVVVENLSEGSYQVAEDQSMLAWQNGGGLYDSSTLVFMNLNSGVAKKITAGSGNYIMPLGFMGEDLIYGVARQEDVGEDLLGYLVFPMNKIVIQDVNGQILKTYTPDGLYVTECTIEDNQISLSRVRKDGDAYVAAANDQIMYNEEIVANRNQIDTAATENMGTVVQIAVKNSFEDKKVKILTPKEVLFEGSRTLDMVTEETAEVQRYYVYGATGVVDVHFDPAEAVMLAYENAGTVTDKEGNYIWKRDRLNTVNQIMAITADTIEEGESSLSVCLDSMLTFNGQIRDCAALLAAGQDAMEILQEGLEGHTVLNLKGCSLDMVLYYPDRERPVLALLQNGSAVLVVGFNEQNVVLMNPSSGKVYKMGMNDARTMFEENGNHFIAYW